MVKTCNNCGRETKNAKFCSNQCQRDFEFLSNVRKIEEGQELDQVFLTPSSIKRYILYKQGHKCSICKSTNWMNLPVPLILDHINGDPYNNSIDNLRLVCGNCDMQLPTYKSKNRGNGRVYRRQRYTEGKSY